MGVESEERIAGDGKIGRREIFETNFGCQALSVCLSRVSDPLKRKLHEIPHGWPNLAVSEVEKTHFGLAAGNLLQGQQAGGRARFYNAIAVGSQDSITVNLNGLRHGPGK